MLNIRLAELLKKLPRVDRKALDVFSLSLCVYRIECKGALAGTRQPGDYNEFISGDAYIDITKVMLSGTYDVDVLIFLVVIAFCFLHVS